MWKCVLAAFCFLLIFTSTAATPVYTDQLPRFQGDTWAVADPDGEFVAMFVFEPGRPGEGRAMFYSYDVPTDGLRLEWDAPYRDIQTGYEIEDRLGNPHTIEITNDGLIMDGGEVVPATIVDQVARSLVIAACLDNCRRNECSGSFVIVCCPCCFCTHACLGISFMDWLCCDYLYGCD
jgi:hypothetical protein